MPYLGATYSLGRNVWSDLIADYRPVAAAFGSAASALTARQSYVANTHPEWSMEYQSLRAQAPDLLSQNNAAIVALNGVDAWLKANPGAPTSNVPPNVSPLNDTEIRGIRNRVQSFISRANAFVAKCDDSFRQEQAGVPVSVTSAQHGNNVLGIPIPDVGGFLSSLSGNAKWLFAGVAAIAILPPLLNLMRRR